MENSPLQKENRIGKIISHYKIIDYLGGGGMGMVFKAEDLKLKRTVALKFLPIDLTSDEQAKVRFMHEAQAASALDHPRIGTIYEIDETDDGEMFIAMACYEGATLKKKMDQESLSIEEVINLIIQIANGLVKAHEEGIVHRDIKPANIIITEEGFVKIVDFGLAKLGGATRITKAGTSMGTPAYMSPEQVRGQDIDHRSDIWSLGVILYELLTKKLPFKADYEMALLYSIVHEEPTPISQFNEEIPTELEQIVSKAITKNDAERYSSIKDMLDDLKAYQSSRSLNTDGMNTIVIKEQGTILVNNKQGKPFTKNLNEKQTILVSGEGKDKRSSVKSKFIIPISLLVILTIFVIIKFSNIQDFFKSNVGNLNISSNPPGALIALNGNSTGESTPSILGPLEIDNYEVTLSLAGFENWSQSVTVTENDTFAVSPQLTAVMPAKREEILSDIKPAFGNLSVSSKPNGAQIYLDGQSTGKTTPARLSNLIPGKHEVQLKYKDHESVTKTVTIFANQAAEISETLKMLIGSLMIESEPQGALIYLDEKSTNQKTPYKFTGLSARQYAVRLTLEDYVDQEKQVIIKQNEEETIQLQFTVKPEGALRVSAVILEKDTEKFAIANIYIDGKAFGQTPNSFSLNSGAYTVTAKLFGHTPKTPEQQVTIQSGKEEIIKFEFIKN